MFHSVILKLGYGLGKFGVDIVPLLPNIWCETGMIRAPVERIILQNKR